MTAQTTVRQLTAINVKALELLGVAEKLGATYAVFAGTPAQALAAVETANGTDNRRSIAAVVRKLADGTDNKHVSVNIEAAMAEQDADEATAEDEAVAAAEAAVAIDQDQPADEQADVQPVEEAAAEPVEQYLAAVELGDVVMAQHPEAGRATRALVVDTRDGVTVWFPQMGSPEVERASAQVATWDRPRTAAEVSKSWVRRARRALDAVELDGGWAQAAGRVAAADDANRGATQD